MKIYGKLDCVVCAWNKNVFSALNLLHLPLCVQKEMRKPFLYTQKLNCIVCRNIVGEDRVKIVWSSDGISNIKRILQRWK